MMSEVNQSKLTPITRKTELNPEQELFCQLYATDREFFGNGTQAYIEAYNIDLAKKGAYQTAMSSASRLLRNDKILIRLDELMELGILNNARVDKELAFLIEQNAELNTKLGAIKEYNALKTRIKNKIDLNLKAPLSNIKFVFTEDGNEENKDIPKTETSPQNTV